MNNVEWLWLLSIVCAVQWFEIWGLRKILKERNIYQFNMFRAIRDDLLQGGQEITALKNRMHYITSRLKESEE